MCMVSFVAQSMLINVYFVSVKEASPNMLYHTPYRLMYQSECFILFQTNMQIPKKYRQSIILCCVFFHI